jgi:hypothetical protein
VPDGPTKYLNQWEAAKSAAPVGLRQPYQIDAALLSIANFNSQFTEEARRPANSVLIDSDMQPIHEISGPLLEYEKDMFVYAQQIEKLSLSATLLATSSPNIPPCT